MTEDKIEILSVELLNQHRSLVNELRVLARRLRLDFGWHYLLDLVWLIQHLGVDESGRVIDAGAGVGLMQWYLAGKGVDVYSVDRGSREDLDLYFRARYKVSGLRPEDLLSGRTVVGGQLKAAAPLAAKAKRQMRNLASLGRMLLPAEGKGRVSIYNQDLKTLVDIPDNSVDGVVAVSALEHNTPEGLRQVVTELLRVLKPGGRLVATLGAAAGEDWFHEPSKGWNYSAASLREIFQLDAASPDNYGRHAELLQALRDCAELRDNLAAFYSRSGDNGMPWGKWDPQYIPVGVCKVKTADSGQ